VGGGQWNLRAGRLYYHHIQRFVPRRNTNEVAPAAGEPDHAGSPSDIEGGPGLHQLGAFSGMLVNVMNPWPGNEFGRHVLSQTGAFNA